MAKFARVDPFVWVLSKHLGSTASSRRIYCAAQAAFPTHTCKPITRALLPSPFRLGASPRPLCFSFFPLEPGEGRCSAPQRTQPGFITKSLKAESSLTPESPAWTWCEQQMTFQDVIAGYLAVVVKHRKVQGDKCVPRGKPILTKKQRL